ncbi:ester hydrolase C11orf54 homolog isoform X2 [Sipha flava]|uniref:Ester hydrolase C11orf54 homolog isoform X2 n=1 Tax=Sipha flava TaxID=143950 RepID=A0A8B8G085_9HEMI|nr:ester hydrolase C11orf54 homolog isoform X2 [Sipha flava]
MAAYLPSTLHMNELPAVRLKLTEPPLARIVQAVLPGLKKNFESVSVEVVPCPDLTQPPFYLATEGLSGNETVIDVGSPSYLLPSVNLDKLYDIKDFKKVIGSDPLSIVGAGAGPWPYVGVNSEFIGNVKFSGNNHTINRSHFYKINPETKGILHGNLPQNETRFALLANFYTSNGFSGEVLKIVCETRKGPLDFVSSIREALANYYGEETVALGGAILIENGKVKVHVMPEFSKTPLNTETELNNWLNFFEVSTPLVGLGYLVSNDPGLDLRPQHFHLFSDHGFGGHYHYDTEPITIKYTAYLNVAKNLIRIDQPKKSLSFGKD